MKETLICDKASSSYPSSVCYFPNRNGQGWVHLKQEGKFLGHRSALEVKQTMPAAVTGKVSLCGSHSSHFVTMTWAHKEIVINFIEHKSGEESNPELKGSRCLVHLPFPPTVPLSALSCRLWWENFLVIPGGVSHPHLWDLQRDGSVFSLQLILVTHNARYPISQSFSGAITQCSSGKRWYQRHSISGPWSEGHSAYKTLKMSLGWPECCLSKARLQRNLCSSLPMAFREAEGWLPLW